MTVQEFNTDKGIYIFELNNIETDFHSHPVCEVIIAEQGNFTVRTGFETYPGLKFAVIAANQKHKVTSQACKLKLIMIERHNRLVSSKLIPAATKFGNDYYFQEEYLRDRQIIYGLVGSIRNGEVVPEYDARILDVIQYLNKVDLEYSLMIGTLKAITHLSESRLSHLFKSTVGISLKKYLVWTKLKSTIKQHLGSAEGLFSSTIKTGFYDQAHFSRSFKTMLGVKPSKAYNSRIIQVFPVPSS